MSLQYTRTHTHTGISERLTLSEGPSRGVHAEQELNFDQPSPTQHPCQTGEVYRAGRGSEQGSKTKNPQFRGKVYRKKLFRILRIFRLLYLKNCLECLLPEEREE